MVVGTVVLAVVAVAVPALMVLCARGTVRRNPLLGIRIPSVMSSDDAWSTGHRAAVLPTTIGAVVAVAGTVVGLAVPTLVNFAPALVLVPLLVGLVWAVIRSNNAALASISPDDGSLLP